MNKETNKQQKAKTVKTKDKKIQKNKGNSKLIIGAVAIILLAGVAYALFSGGTTATNTSSNQAKFPSFVYTSPLTLKAYTYATEHPDILEQIACYCGCGGHSNHRFLRDCFMLDDRTYDEHASFCDTCVAEAIKVQDYLSQGKTLKEARTLIDQEYGTKYPGQNTNTPPVTDGYIPILSPKATGIPTAVQK